MRVLACKVFFCVFGNEGSKRRSQKHLFLGTCFCQNGHGFSTNGHHFVLNWHHIFQNVQLFLTWAPFPTKRARFSNMGTRFQNAQTYSQVLQPRLRAGYVQVTKHGLPCLLHSHGSVDSWTSWQLARCLAFQQGLVRYGAHR